MRNISLPVAACANVGIASYAYTGFPSELTNVYLTVSVAIALVAMLLATFSTAYIILLAATNKHLGAREHAAVAKWKNWWHYAVAAGIAMAVGMTGPAWGLAAIAAARYGMIERLKEHA